MHVISHRALKEFWSRYPQAEKPLRSWYKATSSAEWKKFEDVKSLYGTADRAGQFTIFDIGGNKWRLIVVIHYDAGRIYIRHVFTHAEYHEWNKTKSKKK
jgi:mRNA interferase HigB